MVAPKNYKELTDKMLQLFTDISEEKKQASAKVINRST